MTGRELLKFLSAAIRKFMKSLIWFLWYSKSPVTNPTITRFLMSSPNMTDLANTLANKKKYFMLVNSFPHKFQWEIVILPMTMQEN